MPRIIVTQDDILNGTPQDEHDCAIARAARRAFPRAGYISVTDSITWTDKLGESHSVPLTNREADFIEKFDGNEVTRAKLSPFEILLEKEKVDDGYGNRSMEYRITN